MQRTAITVIAPRSQLPYHKVYTSCTMVVQPKTVQPCCTKQISFQQVRRSPKSIYHLLLIMSK